MIRRERPPWRSGSAQESMMGPCERFEEHWLDYLYGLCEPDEQREMEAHLPLCPTCQAALDEARTCQARLAHAARAVPVVRPFAQPEPDETPLTPSSAPAAAAVVPPSMPAAAGASPAAPATLPLRPRRSLARRLWPVWAAAAAVLALVAGGNHLYQLGLGERDQAMAQARRELSAVDGRLAQLKTDAAAEERLLRRRADAEALRLQVAGPAVTQAGAPFTARVATRDLNGAPQPAQVDVRLIDARTQALLHETKLDSAGEADIAIPGGWRAGDAVRLEVAANKEGKGVAVVRETLKVEPPSQMVHLALNKSIFQPHEVIFFRAVAVERFSLKPVATPAQLRFALVDAGGRALLEVGGQTGPGGIVSGGFALVPALPAGHYSVQASGPGLQPQRRAVELVDHLSDVDIRADRAIHRAGDKMNLDITMRQPDGKPLANQPLVVQPEFGAQPAAAGKALQARTDNEGRARVQVEVPQQLDSSRINIGLQTPGLRSGYGGFAGGGAGAESLNFANNAKPKGGMAKKVAAKEAEESLRGAGRVVRSFAAIPSRLEIDLFPEGGDLIGGLPQRVYFRVRSPSGEPVQPEGHVIVLSSKDVIYDSDRAQGLGAFVFTPDPKEKYTVRITSAMGATEIPDAFARLGIQTEGIVLTAAESVIDAGAPVAVTLRNQGPARRLALVAQCRGQVVGQTFLEVGASKAGAAGSGTAEVKTQLTLPADIAGIIRLTAYEVRGEQMTPRAERLVYRSPSRRLALDVATQGSQAGAKGKLLIQARDEAGKEATPWGLAVVVEDKYRAEAREPSLAAHLLIAGDLGPGFETSLLADVGPEDRGALDLLLGVYGWRRFLPQADEPAMLARGGIKDADANRGQGVEPLAALFSRESGGVAELRAQASQRLQTETRALQARTQAGQAELAEQRTQAAAALAGAELARSEYLRLPGEYLRLALGVLAAASLLAGCALLLFGVVRALRGQRSPTPSFAGALAALAVCFVLYVGSGRVEVELPAKRAASDVRIAQTERKDIAPLDVDPKRSESTRPESKMLEEKAVETAKGVGAPRSDSAALPTRLPKTEGTTVNSASPPSPGPAPARAATAAPTTHPGMAADKLADSQTFQKLDKTPLPRPAEDMDRARDGVPAARGFGGAALMKKRYLEAEQTQIERIMPAPGGPGGGVADKKKAAPSFAAQPQPPSDQLPPGAPATTMLAPPGVNAIRESRGSAREFAYRRTGALDYQPTLLWHPTVRLNAGRAELDFDLPSNPSTFRVLFYGHTDDGRLGFHEGRITTRK